MDAHASLTWSDWTEEAFARAAAERKPVLLVLTPEWSVRWRTMERTSYAEPSIVSFINENFVLVKVDADRRPDIAERYHLGGWPTTAFLTPAGDVLGGGTSISADRFAAVLRQVVDTFRASAGSLPGIMRDAVEVPAGPSADDGPDVLDDEACEWFAERLLAEFDERHGGFGVAPKQPHATALRLALQRFQERQDERFLRVVTLSLDAMAYGGLRDPVTGGFYRCANGADWSDPDHEKTLETNALLLGVYLDAWAALQHPPYQQVALHVLRYVHDTLADRVNGGYQAGEGTTTCLFADVNATMIVAQLRAAEVLKHDDLCEFAIRSLERVVLATYRPGAGVAHYSDGERSVRGLLADQICMAAALLQAFHQTDQAPYLDLAEELIHYSLRTMWDGVQRGFFDRAADEPGVAVGLLRRPLKPLIVNAEAARVLLDLARATGNDEWRQRARETLAALRPRSRDLGLFGASYALAVREALGAG